MSSQAIWLSFCGILKEKSEEYSGQSFPLNKNGWRIGDWGCKASKRMKNHHGGDRPAHSSKVLLLCSAKESKPHRTSAWTMTEISFFGAVICVILLEWPMQYQLSNVYGSLWLQNLNVLSFEFHSLDTERNADKKICLTNTVFTTPSSFFNLQTSIMFISAGCLGI